MIRSANGIWRAVLLGVLLTLVACGSSTPSESGLTPDFGNAPRPSTMSPTGLLLIASLCVVEGGTELSWTDPSGELRKACLIKPVTASTERPLPLLVWLHPSLFPPDTILTTNIVEQLYTANLSGDPTRPGFALLLPVGRDTEHFYPPPDDVGIGWDNWYRNLDRSRADLNVDVAAIDHFIAAAKDSGGIDLERIYLSGWSNGAAMAILYALNTPGIAAAAVYSAPDPWKDIDDPNPQAPFATQRTPIYGLHNSCDVAGICQTGSAMHADLTRLFPGLTQRHVIVDDLALNEVAACNAACGPEAGVVTLGLVNHLRWPLAFTDDMFTFLREHPLP